MAITARRLRRLEAWSDWRAAGGTRQAVIDDALSVRASLGLDNESLAVTLPLNSPSSSFLTARKVIRVDGGDSATNLVPHSHQQDVGWFPRSGSVTANIDAAPDGTITADRFNIVGNGAYTAENILSGDFNGRTFTLAAWLRSPAGARSVTFGLLKAGDAGVGVGMTAATTPQWKRFIFTGTVVGATTILAVYLQTIDGGTGALEIWGVDVRETNQFFYDYIPTSGAAVTVDYFDEYKIVDRGTDDEKSVIAITATPFRVTDLAGSALIFRKDSDGVVVFDFEVLGLTPAEVITNWVLPALAAAGFGWISSGVITPTARLDMTFAWDSPLAVLLRLASATQSELDIRRNGNTGYLIDLVTKVNSGAQVADLRVDKNLVNVTKSETSIEQATRVFPSGADMGDGMRATMAQASWLVSGLSGSTFVLSDPAGGKGPIQFPGQLTGKYVRKVDGTLTLISSSDSSNQQVVVASATGIVNGDLIQIRADSAGADLTYLDDPVAVLAANYGVKAAVRAVPDVPATNNIVKNPAMRVWPGGAGSLPTSWTAVGAPTITKQTAAPFTVIGGQSIKVTSTGDGQGVISTAVTIFPTALNPYLSGYGKIWVASGNARVELVITTPSGTKVFPLLPDVAAPTSLGQWFDVGAAGYDAFAVAATAAQIRIVQNGTAASVFYVDAAQVTQSPSQQPWFEGSGGTRLWQEANEALRTGSNPLVSYAVPLVDLESIDPVTWNESALILGADAHIVDSRMGIDVFTRIVGIERDYLNPQATSITLSNKFDDLTDILAGGVRPDRISPSTPTSTGDTDASVERPMAIVDFAATGQPQVNLIGGAGTASMKLEVSAISAPSDAAVEATTVIEGSAALISYGSPIIPPGGSLYLRAFGYSGASGTGTRSLGLDVVAKRQGSGSAGAPTADLQEIAESQTSMTHRLTGAVGPGGIGPLQYRYRIDFNGATGSWSSWAAFPSGGGTYVDIVTAKALFYPKVVVGQTRDASAVPVESQPVFADIMGRFESHAPTTGRIDPVVPTNSGFNVFQYGSDTPAGIVETAGQKFIDGGALDGSRRPISVYRSAAYEPSTNLFKLFSNDASGVVEIAGRNFIEGGMIDASRRVVNVYRSAATEPVGNLFKVGSNTAADVVTTSSRTFVDPNTATQVDGSGRIVGVYRFGVIEPVNNLVKVGDVLGTTTISVLTLNGSVAVQLTLSGSPTSNLQIAIGNSSVWGTHGAMYSSGYQFISYNAYLNTPGADSWTQSLGSNPSGLLEVRPDGIAGYNAPIGRSVGNKGTFWNALFNIVDGKMQLFQQASTSPGTATTYGVQVSVAGTVRVSIGADTSNAYIQSWASQPLYLNNQGNTVRIGAGGLIIGGGGLSVTGTTYLLSGVDITGGFYASGKVNGGAAINAAGQLRATGWWVSGDSTGLGAELGISGTQAYLYCYNRTTAAYGVVNIGGSDINLVTVSGGIYHDDSAGTKRMIAKVVFSTAAPTGSDYAPDGTIWIRT